MATPTLEEALAVPGLERLHGRVEEHPCGCWLLQKAAAKDGYPQIVHYTSTPTGGRRKVQENAHRYVYRHLVGEIPQGYVVDHLCRVPRCVNPAHLEPVTCAENARRGKAGQRSTCVNGHSCAEHAVTTTRKDGRPQRVCRACRKMYDARKQARRKGLVDGTA